VLGVTIDAIAQNKDYPDEVNQYIGEPTTNLEPDLTEEEALKNINESVDTSNVMESGQGIESVYAYGYACCPDRLKIGATKNDVIQRIVSQINTSTPDKPILYLKIKTPKCMALERAIHATLEIRERKIQGGGTEWFKTTCEEILSIRKFITQVQ
jgi:hypothetical protein